MRNSLLSALKKFRKNEKVSMHIPGHKGGRGLGAYFVRNAFSIDLTELKGTDDLQSPSGILNDAQKRCERAFGAGKSYILTEGSSLGLRAAVIGCAGYGKKLLVDRTCHKSVVSGLVLGGIEPVFINPGFDREKGLYLGISAAGVKLALEKNPDICGAVITSPTYYGVCSDIAGIAAVLHSENKFLIVDEAHGAHFAFGKELPDTALSLGADVCVQSAHKTLPALGQCSFLHIADGAYCDIGRLEKCLRMLQTTSPSYLLMASLDEAVGYMKTRGAARLKSLIKSIDELKAEVCEKTVLQFADSKSLGREQDKTRIVVDFSAAEISGRFAESILIEEFGIYPEMSDERYVVCIPTVASSKKDIRRLCDALCSIGGRRFKERSLGQNMPLPDIEMECLPQEAAFAKTERLAADECEGRICAQISAVCPPGAAILVPGERISREVLEYIRINGTVDKIEVVK